MKNKILNDYGVYVEIELSQSMFCVIDKCDLKRVSKYKWHVANNGLTNYATTSAKLINGSYKKLRMHRLLLNAPKKFHVDHINGDGLDNRMHNLRLCTPLQNRGNQHRLVKGSSKFKGVSWYSKSNKWRACIGSGVHGRPKHLGYFNTELEAAIAYNIEAQHKYGEFAKLNDVSMVI